MFPQRCHPEGNTQQSKVQSLDRGISFSEPPASLDSCKDALVFSLASLKPKEAPTRRFLAQQSSSPPSHPTTRNDTVVREWLCKFIHLPKCHAGVTKAARSLHCAKCHENRAGSIILAFPSFHNILPLVIMPKTPKIISRKPNFSTKLYKS